MSGDVRLAQLEANSFASPYIATVGAAVSRAAETAELSPVLEALLQRSAATLAVRGQRLERNAARIVGVNGTSSLLRAQSNRLSVLMDGSAQLATAAGADLRMSSYAAACAFDGTGRSVAATASRSSTIRVLRRRAAAASISGGTRLTLQQLMVMAGMNIWVSRRPGFQRVRFKKLFYTDRLIPRKYYVIL